MHASPPPRPSAPLLPTPPVAALALAGLLGLGAPASAADLPACEGAREQGMVIAPGGWVFIRRDVRSEFALPDEAAAELERLLAVLEAQGVQVALVMLPTRGMCMAELPAIAAAQGQPYDQAQAIASYRAALQCFRDRGVLTADLASVALSPELPGSYIFPTDHHWTNAGSQASAQALAAVVRASPVAARLPLARFETRPTDIAPRVWTGSLTGSYQAACPGIEVPDLELPRFETVRLDAVEYGLLDEVPPPPVVLVGTSNSDGFYNFGGYLSEALGTDIFLVKKGGGGALAPLQTYLRSDEYIQHRPTLLVWEWPTVDLWIDRSGAPPLWDKALYRQLIASAQGPCDQPLISGTATLGSGEIPLLANPAGLPISGRSHYLTLESSNRTLTRFEILSRYDDGTEERYPLETYGRSESNGRFFLELSAAHQGRLSELLLVVPEGVTGTVKGAICPAAPPTE